MKRSVSLVLIIGIYLLAFVLAYLLYFILPYENFILKIIICDIVGTVIVWFFGVLFKNSSVYDPYWSVAPLVILLFFMKTADFKSLLMYAIVVLWGVRLTNNWLQTFKGLKVQDWRYTYYKEKFPKLWPLVNFFGINMMPTLIVVSVMLPAFAYLESTEPVNFFTFLGALASVLGIGLELLSDIQMHKFQNENSGKVINIGLWKYSRHPNYLGEVTMWWGVFIMMISVLPNEWVYIIGPILNTLLFVWISIPLMEQRQLRNKPEYAEYKAKTSMLLLLPNRKNKEEKEEVYE